MNEFRYASLSGSLLARKGGAKPAMRPQPFATGQLVDDLGWNDHGDANEPAPEHIPSSIAALTPAPKPVQHRDEPVHLQQRALSSHFGEEPAEEAAPEAAPIAPATDFGTQEVQLPRLPAESGRKAAFTLRLEAERHLRLRLASAVTGKSSQQLVTAALDAFLQTVPEVDSLARQLPTQSGE